VIVLRVLLFIAGTALALLVVRSIIASFVVPRPLRTRLARFVFVAVRRLFWLRANERHDYITRDRTMAFYAPVALLVVLIVWVALLLVAFTAMFFALGGLGVLEAFAFAGSAMFTLGFASRGDVATVALDFLAAGTGLVVLALFITYLPSAYAGFQRRERGVSKLEVRAGQPPSGVYLIDLAWRVGRLENLRDLFAEWEDWFTDVDESHSSYPALVYFRSAHPDQSWITAAGAILDAASLYDSTVDIERIPEPQFMIRSGYLCLRHLAEFFYVEVDHDPEPDDPISIRREEFDEACARLTSVGVPLRNDREQCWRDFAGWRVNYDAALVELARITMAPLAPWSSDRYDDVHYIPPALPWVRRRARSGMPGGG
jgi:hypothetical protein